MQLIATVRRALKYKLPLVRHLYVEAKSTQLQTAKMSNLQRTHLEQINATSYQLFQEYTHTPEVQYLNNIFSENGFEIRMAGGCVRDLLRCIVPHDIDFATDARPDQMINMMSDKPDIRLITTQAARNHGTVTARINNKMQYEITTLRIDKQTDGRHAQVEFINDWKIDASRRDLTINSMFIDLNGILYDYFDGRADLQNEIIRFVGDTEKRLKEDYLRIFRYFRFHTRFGKPFRHDEGTLAIMKENIDGLTNISGERIWSEVKRIFSHIQCRDSVEVMFNSLAIGSYMGFKSTPVNLNEFYQTLERLAQIDRDSNNLQSIWKPETLFCSLISDQDELCSIVGRLKLSNLERDTMAYILQNRPRSDLSNVHLYKTQLAMSAGPNQPALRQQIVQYLLYMGASADFVHEIEAWPIPAFPFRGTMVANRVQRKQQISLLINELKKAWAHSDFTMSEEEMAREVDRILEQMKQAP